MNDRFLFKAKRIDNGEWVRGGSLITFCDNGVKSYYMPQFNEKCACEHDDITGDILSFFDCRFYKVDESTLCQCTGLKDKAGNLIWENDLVLTPREDGYSLICWNDTEARWEMHNEAEGIVLDFDNYWSHEVEVVGNRMDNPELMEAE